MKTQWNTGTPDVKEGGCETFWCCVELLNGKQAHRFLDYANRHEMPLADHIDEAPDGCEPVPGSDEDYYWTGWHEKSCDQCETQWMFSGGKVVAWMRLPSYSATPTPDAGEDGELMDWVGELIRECPHAKFDFSDDEADGKPLGFSLYVDGCDPLDVVAPTFHELIRAAKSNSPK